MKQGGSVGKRSCQRQAWRQARSSTSQPSGDDQPGLLGEGDEVRRWNQAALGMLPAGERLEAGDAAAGERDDRLVVHDEVARRDASAELGFELEQLHRGAVQLEVEDLVAPRTRGLGAVHGEVGVAQEPVGAGARGLGEGDADRRRDVNLLPVDGRTARPGARSTRSAMWTRIGGLAHAEGEDGELVPAEPGDGVGRPHELLEPARDRHQQEVADRMAEAVVDRLEAVEIQEQHGEGPLAAARQRR